MRHTAPHFMAYFGVICFANMGGGGCRNCFHLRLILRLRLRFLPLYPSSSCRSGPTYLTCCQDMLCNSCAYTRLTFPPAEGSAPCGNCTASLVLGFFCWGGTGWGEPGICDGRMPLSKGQTTTVLPKRCDTPCLAQERPKLRNSCMTVRCRAPDGQRHRTVM